MGRLGVRHSRNPFAAYFARGIIGWLYRAFGWTTGLRVRALPDYAASLLRRGLLPMHDRRYLAGLLCFPVMDTTNLRER